LQRKWELEGDDIVDRVTRDNPKEILEVMAVTVEQRDARQSIG
jgi:hypothetical protein